MADMARTHDFHVIFFCMGNICRSPTAHGVFRSRLATTDWAHRVRVDSAGTHNYHPGSAPDPRTQRHAGARGWDLSDLRARQLHANDFEQADLLLGMDWDNMALAEAMCPPPHRSKLRRLTEFCLRHTDTLVPDPYYSGDAGFELVLDLVEDASEGLLRHIERVLHERGAAT
jgi:protein-tyrosine phosphatase